MPRRAEVATIDCVNLAMAYAVSGKPLTPTPARNDEIGFRLPEKILSKARAVRHNKIGFFHSENPYHCRKLHYFFPKKHTFLSQR
ncbi:MAG: hypothetical protein J6T41_03145 [Neisseriaceae bacterium]|nr:hypothetical protein [Neisseriaceae bacterium]